MEKISNILSYFRFSQIQKTPDNFKIEKIDITIDTIYITIINLSLFVFSWLLPAQI